MKEKNKITDYLSTKEVSAINKFSKDKQTPFLVINLKKVAERYDELAKNMPFAKIYFAIKANPNNDILKLLKDRGSNLDVASVYEIDQLLELGVSPVRISLELITKKKFILLRLTKKVFGCLPLIQKVMFGRLPVKLLGLRSFFELFWKADMLIGLCHVNLGLIQI